MTNPVNQSPRKASIMHITTDRHGYPILRLPRRILTLIMALAVVATLAGCSTSLCVSSQQDLVGTRMEDTDSYSGQYSASYHEFTGTETLFGGTGKHATIHITGHILDEQGTVAVLESNGSDTKQHVPIHDGSFDQTYTVDGTSFYIYATGEHYTGRLTLTAKNQ